MTYPTPPGPRIAYDLDGTLGLVSGVKEAPGLFETHPKFLRAMNSDSPRLGGVEVTYLRDGTSINSIDATLDFPPAHMVALRFPEPMRIRALSVIGLWGLYSSESMGTTRVFRLRVETSDDSTNGVDGTWATLFTSEDNSLFPTTLESESRGDETYGFVAAVSGMEKTSMSVYPNVNSNFRRQSTGPGEPGWRTVTGGASRQVTWLRLVPYQIASGISISGSQTSLRLAAWYKLHLYGEPDTAADDDRLGFTDVAGAEKLSFDWGDIGQGSEYTQGFRVKNLSDDLTATGVQVSILSPNPTVLESPQTWLQMSDDGVIWDTSLVLPDLGPGESSDPITLRVQAGVNLVGPSGPRLAVEVEEWV